MNFFFEIYEKKIELAKIKFSTTINENQFVNKKETSRSVVINLSILIKLLIEKIFKR